MRHCTRLAALLCNFVLKVYPIFKFIIITRVTNGDTDIFLKHPIEIYVVHLRCL